MIALSGVGGDWISMPAPDGSKGSRPGWSGPASFSGQVGLTLPGPPGGDPCGVRGKATFRDGRMLSIPDVTPDV